MSQEARACIDMCLQYAGEVWNNGPDLSLASDEQEKMAMQAYARAGEYYIEYLMDMIVRGEYDQDLLTEAERNQIELRLK